MPGGAFPYLLEAFDDQRVRVAIYALRHALLALPPLEALNILRQVPLEKVTVAKEVVRLLGELPSEIAYTDLLAMEGRDLHRDVRIALLRAFWDHLERDETWPILEHAARAEDPAIADGVICIPSSRLAASAQRRLAALMVLLLRHQDAKVRIDTMARCWSLPLSDPDGVIANELLQSLQSALPDECRAGAQAVFQTFKADEASLIGEAIREIIANRHRLTRVLSVLGTLLPWQRERLLPATRAVLDSLRDDPLTAMARMKLAIAALPWPELGAFLTAMVGLSEFTAEVLMCAVASLEESDYRSDAEDIATLETSLSQQADERLRRLGLAALVALANPARGWDDALLARLHQYRDDPSPLVASAAQFTFPPGEES